jgi:3-oxoacyl-[acyl-carrier-protein] synthase-1
MSARPLVILSAGLITPVGLAAQSSCAAIRAKISNPTETRFVDSSSESVMAHQVPLERPWRGLTRLAKMAGMAIAECLAPIAREEWLRLPMLLCVAERERPGRLDGIDDRLLSHIQTALGATFGPESQIVAAGRVSMAVALAQARKLIYEHNVVHVLIAATDSLLNRATFTHYEENDRLLTQENSNGFMPGEGASAVLVGKPTGKPELRCIGLGFGVEKGHIESEEPLRADGLTLAHKAALSEAGLTMDDMDYRITDLSGEQYYFKEASLAYSRLLRLRRNNPELWHPAECTGASGAALGGICVAVARAAGEEGYAPGRAVLLHFSDDNGQRASIVALHG